MITYVTLWNEMWQSLFFCVLVLRYLKQSLSEENKQSLSKPQIDERLLEILQENGVIPPYKCMSLKHVDSYLYFISKSFLFSSAILFY